MDRDAGLASPAYEALSPGAWGTLSCEMKNLASRRPGEGRDPATLLFNGQKTLIPAFAGTPGAL
jgi:hypothetical protein